MRKQGGDRHIPTGLHIETEDYAELAKLLSHKSEPAVIFLCDLCDNKNDHMYNVYLSIVSIMNKWDLTKQIIQILP